MARFPAKLFLCYARDDLAHVKGLYERLTKCGLRPWMDTKNIYGGEDWQRSIWRAIREAHYFLFCVSHNSTGKRGFLQREIKQALEIWEEKLEDDIYLIPLRLEDCLVPPSVARFQRIDLFAADGFDRLLSAVETGIGRRGITTTGPPSNTQTTSNEIKEESEEHRFSLRATYPQLTLVDSESVTAINRTVESFVKTICDKWRAEAVARAKHKHEMEEHLRSTSWDDLSISYSISMNTSELFSIQFSLGTYGAGAAHPNSVTRTLNFRRDSGAQVSLSDVFLPGADYLSALSAYCVADLQQQAQKRSDPSVVLEPHDAWIAGGAGPAYHNFERFVLEPGGLRIFFDPYQVDCYASGRYEVYVPLPALAKILDPELARIMSQ